MSEGKSEGKETVVNFLTEESGGLFTSNRGLAGELKRNGVKLEKENESGWWFDLSSSQVVVKIEKKRGEGYKEVELYG